MIALILTAILALIWWGKESCRQTDCRLDLERQGIFDGPEYDEVNQEFYK